MSSEYNNLTPTTSIESASAFHVVTWAEVQIDLSTNAREVYKQGGTGYGENRVDFYALTNVALSRLMNAAGIKQTGSVRVDAGENPHVCSWQFSAEYTQPDSTVLAYSADYELDLRDYIQVGEQTLRGARFEKALQDERVAVLKSENDKDLGKLYGEKLNAKADVMYAALDDAGKKHVDDLAEAKALRYIVQMRQFIVQRAQTGAMERAIRKMLNLKSTYTLEELKKPFRVPRSKFDWDRLDKAIGVEASAEMRQLQAMKLLGINPDELAHWKQLNAPKQQALSAPTQHIDILGDDLDGTAFGVADNSEKSVDMPAPVLTRVDPNIVEWHGQLINLANMVGPAFADGELKAWYSTNIVKKLGRGHYENHLKKHFGGKSTVASLTWRELILLEEKVINGVAYPDEVVSTNVESGSLDEMISKLDKKTQEDLNKLVTQGALSGEEEIKAWISEVVKL